MTFDYKIISLMSSDRHGDRLDNMSIESTINYWARQGWRVVSFGYECTVLERPSP